jgi:hypothetical protein
MQLADYEQQLAGAGEEAARRGAERSKALADARARLERFEQEVWGHGECHARRTIKPA